MIKKILIVDDSIDLRKLVSLALDFPDFKLSEAESAEEAFSLIKQDIPDLIVLDVMLAGKLNGFQLCKHLKNNPLYDKIKIILLTAKGLRVDVQEGLSAKSDAYMVKPFSPTLLQKKVDDLLQVDHLNMHLEEVSATRAAGHSGATLDISEEFGFPSRPESLINIQQEMSQPTPNIQVVAQHIAEDITLSAALLKTVNSPFYGLANKVSSVNDAVNLIGLTRALHLVMAVSVRHSIELPANLKSFWDDSIKVAVMESCIARHLAFDPDLAYLMGLFHDCAVPLMSMKYPDYLDTYFQFYVQEEEIPELEQAKYTMNHALMGNLLARNWYLPSSLCDAIRLHHNADIFTLGLDNTTLNILSVHLLADNIADQLEGRSDIHFLKIEGQIRKYLALEGDLEYQSVIDYALESIHENQY